MATSVSVEERARRKGRAYQCLRCLERTGKQTIDVKYRIEDHILKVHLSLDEVPFYCSLCMFRCTEEADLIAYVSSYRKHRLMAADSPHLDTRTCLVKNANPHQIGDSDVSILTQEQSREHWMQTMRKKADPLQTAINQVFPGNWLEAQAGDGMSVCSGTPVRSDTTTKPLIVGETESMEPGSMVLLARQLKTLTEQTQQLIASTEAQSVEEWMSTNQDPPAEDILQQILGQGEDKVIGDEGREEKQTEFQPPTKRARSASPSFSCSSSSTIEIVAAIRKEGKKFRETVGEVLGENRSVLLEVRRALDRQTEAIVDLTKTLRTMSEKSRSDRHHYQEDHYRDDRQRRRDDSDRRRPLGEKENRRK